MRASEFEGLLRSIGQMKEFEAGRPVPVRVTSAESVMARFAENASTIRAQFGMSQRQFARMMGISVNTLQNWEQGRRRPDGPARVLLRVAAKHPEALASIAADTFAEEAKAYRKGSTSVGRVAEGAAKRGVKGGAKRKRPAP